MKSKNEKTKFYVEMDGRWAQISGSEEELHVLLKKVKGTRPIFGKTGIHIMHIN